MKQHSIVMHSLLLAGVLSIMQLAISCSNGWTPSIPNVQDPVELITVALPYVDAVHVPDEIHAGQPFNIELELSSEHNPNALHTPAHPFAGDVGYSMRLAGGVTQVDYFVSVNLYRDMARYDASSPAVSTVEYSIQGLSAGLHELGFTSARTRAEGGKEVVMNKYDGYWTSEEKTDAYLHRFILTVLP